MTRFFDSDLDLPLDLPVDPGPGPHERYAALLLKTEQLYQRSASKILTEHAELVPKPGEFLELMGDLHRGLVLKTYSLICEADNEWSHGEQQLATVLTEHLWNRSLKGKALRETMRKASESCARLEWLSLLRPFQQLPPLFDQIATLETLLIRQANLIARVDGQLKQSEHHAIQQITDELQRHLSSASVRQHATDDLPDPTASEIAIESASLAKPIKAEPSTDQPAVAVRSLDDVLAELNGLIGLKAIKHEIRSLVNYLALQNKREAAGLPKTDIGLHLVFVGNPGTGKTTVARLIGEAFQAMGILDKGHMIETDRSGLVAEYAGQTAVKSNKRIDEAIDGVLFIDEAYGLVATESDDPYGNEAVQTLLKRAEDDRHRLAVILAGYPAEMETLLQTNPGLQSRFNKTLHFEDYSPLELCQIFGRLLQSHHYRITSEGRLRVIATLTAQQQAQQTGYGNGREVRNLFEKTILRMANRLADMPTITEQQLVTFVMEDIEPTGKIDFGTTQILIVCPGCQHGNNAPAKLLGARLTCPKCAEKFRTEWCALVGA